MSSFIDTIRRHHRAHAIACAAEGARGDESKSSPGYWAGARTVDLIVTTGGLGPTEDDITRDAVAHVLDVPLEMDEAIAARIQTRFAERGLPMPEINRRQALVPRGATVLENRRGSAPGLWIERGGTAVVVLPGAREMTPMPRQLARSGWRPTTGTGLFRASSASAAGPSRPSIPSAAHLLARLTQPVPRGRRSGCVGQIELHLTQSLPAR